MDDLISRQAAIDALLGITAMRNTIPLDSAIFNIKKLPSAQPTLYGYNIEHLDMIARVLQKEDLPPERVVEAIEYSIKRERRERREDEHTMEEFMYGQDMGNPEDGSL